MKKIKKASIFVFALIFVIIASFFGIIILNNIQSLHNLKEIENINDLLDNQINQNSSFAIINDKNYNWNGSWFIDNLSCPNNITMSWIISKEDNISSNLRYIAWNFTCSWTYNWVTNDNFYIFFNDNYLDFKDTTYKNDLIDLVDDWVNTKKWEREFNDSDSTLISFDTSNLENIDKIDEI